MARSATAKTSENLLEDFWLSSSSLPSIILNALQRLPHSSSPNFTCSQETEHSQLGYVMKFHSPHMTICPWDWPSTPSFSFLLYDFLFMCVVYVFVMSVCTHTCVLGYACIGVETRGIFLNHCSPYCLRQRFSMNM